MKLLKYFFKIPAVTVNLRYSIFNIMPRKSKGKLKSNRSNTLFPNHGYAEVFRNSSAVSDDTDPVEALKCMKEIFKNKIEDDVIAMIFSECSYDVNQTFETLSSLCNYGEVDCLPKHDDQYNENSLTKISESESDNTTLQFSVSDANSFHNSAKWQAKSKLAINFPSSSGSTFDSPTHHYPHEIFGRDHQSFASKQSKNPKLLYNYSSETSDSISFENSAARSSSYKHECNDSFNSDIPPIYFSSPDNSNAVENASSSVPYAKQAFEDTEHQFISPVLPMPVYRMPSPKNFEGSTFRNTSRNFHFSPTLAATPGNSQKKISEIAKAAEKIQSGSQVLVILRGLPGSGKSSLAVKLKYSGEVFSTDEFFIQNGEYIFDPSKLNEAHAWNKQRTKQALEKGKTPIIIDNTNVEAWEMAPYVLMGKKYNYEIIILEPDTPWKFNVKVLTMKNKHKVSKSKIQRMKERYQHNITVERILKSCNFLNSNNNEDFSLEDTFKELSKISDEKFKKHDDFKTNSHICLVDIHQEKSSNDNAQCEETPFNRSSSLDQLEANFHMSFDNESVSSSDGLEMKNTDIPLNADCDYPMYNAVTDQPITINDLDDLKALVRQDSEESHSLQSSTTGSFQDVACWEALTEHDEDFLWTTVEQDKGSTAYNKDRDVDEIKIENSITRMFNEDSYQNNICKITEKGTADNLSTNLHIKSKNSFEESISSTVKLSSDTGMEKNSGSSSSMCNENSNILLNDERKNKNDSDLSLKKDFQKLWIDKNSSESEIKCSHLNDLEHATSCKEKLSQSFECITINKELNLKAENFIVSVSNSMPQLINNNKLFQEKDCAVSNESKAVHVCENAELTSSESVSSNEECKVNNLPPVKDQKISNTKSNLQKSHVKPKQQEPVFVNHDGNFDKGYFESISVPDSWKFHDSENDSFFQEFSDKENKLEDLLVKEKVGCSPDSINLTQPKPQRHNSNCISKFYKESFRSATVPDVNISFIDENSALDWNISNKETEESNVDKPSEVEKQMPVVPKPQRSVFESKSSTPIRKSGATSKLSGKSFLNISMDAIQSDWKMPDYYVEDDAPKKKSPIKISSPINFAQHSQTEPKDFVFIHNISNGDNCVSSGYKVLNADPTNLLYPLDNDSNLFVAESETHVYSKVASFDKSTSTDDMMEETEISEKLSHLHECFPDISEEDLHHLLEICHNDEAWLSNLLLEWGYKYNVQEQNVKCTEEKSNIQKVLTSSSRLIKDEEVKSDENRQPVEEGKEQNLSEVDISSILDETEVSKANPLTSENTDSSAKLRLILNTAFARQLEELFGPVTSSCTKADRCIEIDLEFAQLLHTMWKKSATQAKKTPEKDLFNEDAKLIDVGPSGKEPKELLPMQKNPNEPLSLAEIMDMEYALQLHKEEKLQKDSNFAIKLKRQELYSMYPGADTIALDEIFESNNYCLNDCIYALGEDLGQPQTVQQKHSVRKMDQCLVEWSKRDIFQEFESGDYSDWVYKEEDAGSIEESTIPVASSVLAPEAAELRELAVKHYKLRQEYISKAQAAYCRGAKDVASFYAQRGSEHGELFKDANKQASLLIAQQRNLSTSSNVLDLHGLYVQEAIPMLEKFLRDKKLDLRRRQVNSSLVVSIITGKGVHSMRGPKLRPSVYEFLRKTGYSFSEVNPGMLDVTVTPE